MRVRFLGTCLSCRGGMVGATVGEAAPTAAAFVGVAPDTGVVDVLLVLGGGVDCLLLHAARSAEPAISAVVALFRKIRRVNRLASPRAIGLSSSHVLSTLVHSSQPHSRLLLP